ncbi:MAG: hypothetical protein SGPRY_007238 [Prymnesium sp.]
MLSQALRRLARLHNWEAHARGQMAAEVDSSPCKELCRLLGRPQAAYRVVHVAGSKGKGTVAALVACALEAAGWRVGVMSSPHVSHVTERLTICGSPVSEELLAQSLHAAVDARDEAARCGSVGGRASWFDTFVAASFHAMALSRVEWAVVECGLGGRLDSTNVVSSDVALLTSVELEHTEVLGSTHAAIAREKASIVTLGGALIAAVEGEAAAEVARVARERGARSLTILPPSPEPLGQKGNLALVRLALNELGRRGVRVVRHEGSAARPEANLSVARDALLSDQLLSETVILRAASRLPARQESLNASCGTPVLVDGAHTPTSVSALVAAIRGSDPPPAALPVSPVVLIGMMANKDAPQLMRSLAPLKAHHVICSPLLDSDSTSKVDHVSPFELASFANDAGVSSSTCENPASGLETALELARQTNAWVLVVGSFRICSQVRHMLNPVHPTRGKLFNTVISKRPFS